MVFIELHLAGEASLLSVHVIVIESVKERLSQPVLPRQAGVHWRVHLTQGRGGVGQRGGAGKEEGMGQAEGVGQAERRGWGRQRRGWKE